MAAHLDVILVPSIGDILLGSGGADTWFRVALLVAFVVGVTARILYTRKKKEEEERK